MPLTGLESQVTGAIEKLSESVVGIDSTKLTRDYRYGLVPIEGQGSGVIIDPSGTIVTNHHVIDDAYSKISDFISTWPDQTQWLRGADRRKAR